MPVPEVSQARLREAFEVLYAPWPDEAAKRGFIATRAADIRAVLTIGSVGLTAAEIDELPALSLVSAMGIGYEKIDVAHAKSKGIVVVNGAGTNADCVADHAFGLLIAAVRSIVELDGITRSGVDRDKLGPRPNVSGKRLGILGYGSIGERLAKRAGGFDMAVGYHNRRRKDDVPHAYFDDLRSLAEWADYLVVATPGGPETKHLVNGEVLAALGPKGYLVNIARGSVVDTAALAEALKAGTIGGAGLDVYESEPAPPTQLLGCPNLVLTPHVAGRSPEANANSVARFLDNAALHFAGRAPISPV